MKNNAEHADKVGDLCLDEDRPEKRMLTVGNVNQ